MTKLVYPTIRNIPNVPVTHLSLRDVPPQSIAKSSQHKISPLQFRGTTAEFDNILANFSASWDTFIGLHSIASRRPDSLIHPHIIFSPWVFEPSEDFFNFVDMLVFEYPSRFDVKNEAPQLRSFERVEYMANDLQTGAEVFRIILPIQRDFENMLWYGRLKQLHTAVKALADGNGTHPKSIGSQLDREKKYWAAPVSGEPLEVHFGNLLTVQQLARMNKILSR